MLIPLQDLLDSAIKEAYGIFFSLKRFWESMIWSLVYPDSSLSFSAPEDADPVRTRQGLE
jgi:hypothetical protein